MVILLTHTEKTFRASMYSKPTFTGQYLLKLIKGDRNAYQQAMINISNTFIAQLSCNNSVNINEQNYKS